MSFYCHCCSSQVTAAINEASYELDCSRCGGQAVELLGQGLDSFISQTPSHQPSMNNEEPLEEGRLDALHRIVSRVLGMDVQVGPESSSSLLGVLQSAVVERGAPVGIVIRQATSPQLLDSLSSLLGHRSEALSGRALDDFLHRVLMSEGAHSGAPPTPEVALSKLPRCTLLAEQAAALGSCGILHEPFAEGDVAVSLRCGHAYREEPILTWLRQHNSCPICRVQIAPDGE